MSASIGELRGRITMDASGFRERMGEARSELSKTSNSSKNLTRDFEGIQKASLVVGGAVLAGIGGSVKIAADFEKQMSRVKAISGATDSEFQKLKETAMNLGATTSKSASEVAVGMEDMAAMGFNVNEVMAAMPGVISAAEASGSDLALTSGIVASALNAFQMEASDASNVADILAMTANVSAAGMEDMGYALKYVGPVASALGISLEEVSAGIGVMTNAGLDGSSAGTALRAALLALNNPAKAQEKIMDELGFSMRDAEGNAKGLSEIVGDLQKATEGMTEAEKVATVAKLVGTEASAGMISLMAAGPETIDKMTESLENSAGAAKETADIMMDNVLGAWEEFGGAMETLGIKIGDEFLPIFKEIIELGSEFVEWISEFDGESIKLTLSFAAITSGIALALSTLGKLSIALSAFALTPVGAAVIGISLLSGVVGTAILAKEGMNEVTLETADALVEEQTQLQNSVARFDELKGSMSLTGDELQRFVDINALMKQTTDPAILTALKDEQAALLEKSTLTNTEFDEFLQLNNDLIAVMPEATVTISDQGYALLDSTDAAKGLNAEMARKIELELEAQLAKAEANEAENLRTQKQLQEEINGLAENKGILDQTILTAQISLNDYQRQYNEAKAAGDDREAVMLEGKISQQEAVIEGAKREKAEEAELIIKKMEELDLTNEQIGKLQEAKDKIAEITLAQVGLNSKKGEELEAIDNAKLKLIQERRELEKNTPVSARNTGEYRQAVNAINDKISALETARQKVFDITGAAGAMNAELGKGISKTVTIRTVGGTARNKGGQSLKRLPDLDYHSGGIAGRPPLPKLHSGGPAFSVMDSLNSMLNAPMHNEVDARLLRNEMVLTESQQANLMRFIDAGHTQNSNGDSGIENTREIVQTLLRIAEATEAGHEIVMSERKVGQMVAPYVKESHKLKQELKSHHS